MASEVEDFERDFREALEDLQMNTRYDIQNLTMIARENTEHALAISQVLQDHIKRVAPHKKLPALYVMDSIVKNVGTPYTLFFGKRLFQTYMDAYASVDMATRRKMDEMLKTWKEPIPGSIDTRPVFPPDVTRPIENALIKARTSAMHAQQQNMRTEKQLLGRSRPVSQGLPYRDTPTPPGAGYRPPPGMGGHLPERPAPNVNGNPYGQSPPPPQAQAHYPLHQNHVASSRSTPQLPTTMPAYQPPYAGGYGMPQPGLSVEALNGDIQQLISAFKSEFSRNPHDPSIQTRLKALLDLKFLLENSSLPMDQLVLVKKQITELAVTIRAPPAQPPTPVPIPQAVAVAPPPAAAQPVSLESLLGPGALAALAARSSATPQVPTPQPPPAALAATSPPPPSQRSEPPKPATPDPMVLMSALRKAGMLSGAAAPSSSTPVPVPVPVAMPNSMPSLPAPFPLPFPGTGPPTMEGLTSDIVFKAASLKQFRPHLTPFLFEALGPQCTQCGRRFKTDEEGKKKKTAHMDWHFKVNQRIAEAEKRGQHRSWFVDEMDWINSRDTIDEDHVSPMGDSSVAYGSAAKIPKLQFIPVPDDPMMANSVCPICQEKFETRWLDDAQEFVWPDALCVGDRIYHASCHKEAGGGGGGTAASMMYSRNTPEPVLGKRKAEEDLLGLRGKFKIEA